MFYILYEHTTGEPIDGGTYPWVAFKPFHDVLC
jgi:hypothetical protein